MLVLWTYTKGTQTVLSPKPYLYTDWNLLNLMLYRRQVERFTGCLHEFTHGNGCQAACSWCEDQHQPNHHTTDGTRVGAWISSLWRAEVLARDI